MPSTIILHSIRFTTSTHAQEQEGERTAKKVEAQRAIDENFGPHLIGRVRSKLWNLTEYPESGKDAQFSAFFSLFVVVISTATFVIGTLEEFQGLFAVNFIGIALK